jgi:thioredoxin 1
MNNSAAILFLKLSVITTLFCGCDVREQQQTSGGAKPANPQFFHGQTIASVQEILGEPDGVMTSGKRTVLLYSGITLEFTDGKWTNPQPDIRKQIDESKKARAKQAKTAQNQPAKTVVTKIQPAVAKAQPAAASPVKSAASEYSGLITMGKITVVDFYATWCGSCKQIAPVLDNLVRGQSDVTLRKVDIGNWGSSTAKKYNITSVPNIRVFDKKGRMVGSPTSNPNQVAQNIEQARKSQ